MGRKAVLKERKAGIKKTMDELGVRAMESKDVKEVRSMNETLKKLKECVDEIQEEIENTPDDTDDGSGGEDGGTGEERQIVPPTAQLRGGNPMASYGQRTFNLNGGIATKANGIDALSLRSDESMVDRLPPTERKPLDLGKYVRGVVTGC